MSKPTLAVIGSGIAGLSAAWLLRKKYNVTLFERHSAPGMGAYSVNVGQGGHEVIIDIPLRVITAGYYNELFKLYQTLGVRIERTDHAGAFFTHTGADIFHYKNFTLGKYSFSFLNSPQRLSHTNLKQGMAAIKFFYSIKRVDLNSIGHLTFGEFLAQWPHTQTDFIDHVLMPMLSTICTCDYDSIRRYPAAIIIDYLACGVAKEGVWKATHGVADIIKRITEGYEVKPHSDIKHILTDNDNVSVILSDDSQHTFDQVIIATQPQHAGPMLEKENTLLSKQLKGIQFESSQMVVHRDQHIYPKPWQDLSPVCYSVNKAEQRPMATVCLNKSMPTVKKCPPVFQTWHPTTSIASHDVLADVTFERPVINFETLKRIDAIKNFMRKDNNTIWFCGSYLGGGIPLLEAGVRSSLSVAHSLGVEAPW